MQTALKNRALATSTLVLASFLATGCHGGTGSGCDCPVPELAVTIFDSASGQPINSARIYEGSTVLPAFSQGQACKGDAGPLPDGGPDACQEVFAACNPDGLFTCLGAGTHHLSATAVGYVSTPFDVTVVNQGGACSCYTLQASAGAAVVVTTEGPNSAERVSLTHP